MTGSDRANPFVDLEAGSDLQLPESERLAAAGHLWSRNEIDALILAWAARHPLLVRGEVGSGKSQIARAAAAVEGVGPLLVEVIHPRFEALDLLYQVDVIARLADAQDHCLDRTNVRYVNQGRLWEAITHDRAHATTPVLLIDEIDKADADVPNALLEVLGNRSFPVPPLGSDKIVTAQGDLLPLIVITTNEERELPAAFVRRCIVLNVDPPRDPGPFIEWLVRRGRVHEHLEIDNQARRYAASQVQADRRESVRHGYPVGLAEYIDLLTALHDLTRSIPADQRAAAQIDWAQRISAYALVKHAGQKQDRPPVPLPRRGAEAAESG